MDMTLSADTDNFDQSCYYAPSGQPFTIDFTNSALAESDNTPTTVQLVISPSQNPAFAPDPANSELMGGSTQSAVFVSQAITAPNTVELSVPALSSGTYDLQLLGNLSVVATLVVQ
jgi:hypothetical protein